MERREFLLWLGMTGLTTIEGMKMWNNSKEEKIESDIYDLVNHVHIAEHSATIDGKEKTLKGAGIFLDNYYLSMAHIPYRLNIRRARTPYGITDIPVNAENKKSEVNGINLERLVLSPIQANGTDVYIAKPDKYVINFPCEPSENFNYGEEVYIIGNPHLLGFNIRKGYISDLNGFANKYGKEEDAFGVDFSVHPGDSGCPLVNKDFKLLGLAKYDAVGKFGYINKIGLYLDAIQELKEIVTKPIYENQKTSK